jgi:hypothetical protein
MRFRCAIALALSLTFLGELSSLAAQTGTRLQTAKFSEDPSWEGFRNQLRPDKPRITRQTFGPVTDPGTLRQVNQVTTADINTPVVGGWIQRSMTPAWYALPIEPKSFEQPLRASGKFSVTQAEGASGMLVGWFNDQTRGWRTAHSLAFRIDGNGGKYWVFYEYGTSEWGTGGAGCFDGEQYQTTKTKPFLSDGTVHAWRLDYDPAAGEHGLMQFALDNVEYKLPLTKEHRREGAVLNRFGLFNQQIAGDGMNAYFWDLEIDGKQVDSESLTHWQGEHNQTEHPESGIRPFHNFGFSQSAFASGRQGELGGLIWRDELPAYYAADIGKLSLEDELYAEGKVAFRGAGSDSGVYLGWFDSQSKRRQSAQYSRPGSLLAIAIEGPSRVGHFFRPIYRPVNGDSRSVDSGPRIFPDGKVREWSIRYTPPRGDSQATILVNFDGHEQKLAITPEDFAVGATFDRFGLFTMEIGGHYVELYVDDLKFTTRED